MWEIFPDKRYLALFHGNLKGCEDFLTLAVKAYRLLCETDPKLDPRDGYHGWLGVIHEIAVYCPTPDVNYKMTRWGLDDLKKRYPSGAFPDRVTDVEGNMFQPNPVQRQFTNCLFRTAAAVLQMFYAPHRVTFLWDEPWPHKLSKPLGWTARLVPWQLCAAFADTSLLHHTTDEIAKSGIRDAVMNMYNRLDFLLRPRFVEGPNDSGELMLGGRRLRKVRAKSKFLCSILREFECQGWPTSIDMKEDSKLEHQARSFHTQMNHGQEGPYQIEFSEPHSGKKIAWKVVEAIVSPSQPDTSEQQDG